MTDILIPNDDGINAPGLTALHREIAGIGEVSVVAPMSEKSAVGHAITLSDPIRVSRVKRNGDFFGFGVHGTPSDCVKIAVKALLDRKPDILLSGINQGPNTGINVIYSGTVSAATEGTIFEIPSIAVSLASFTSKDFAFAASITRKLALSVLESGLPPGVLLNLNVPAVESKAIKGVKITRQGLTRYEETFIRRVDPRNRTYYWMDGEKIELLEDDDVDDRAIEMGWVSLTPIHYDLTSYKSLDILKSWDIRALTR